MLVKAVSSFQICRREFKENEKNQYLDRVGSDGAKTFFRVSEFGSGDRKLVYSFFKHQLPKSKKSAKNLRALENGDYVHLRFQTLWDEMGIMLEPKKGEDGKYNEIRLSSKDDDYLKDMDWELYGHYDALLDMNVVHAHANNLCTVTTVFNEETNKHEMDVELDEEYAIKIGMIVEQDGRKVYNENYEPLKAVADIKSMNPWGVKRLKEGNVAEITGYIDQISLYMFMLNVPYGILFVEDKAGQDLVEVQVVWEDMHEDSVYTFDIFGSQEDNQVRVRIDNERFFGLREVDEDSGEELITKEGLLGRIDRIWGVVKALKELDEAGAAANEYADVMPLRCHYNPSSFPCSWGGGAEKCEFFDHCWDSKHQGVVTRPTEDVPAECRWEIGSVTIDSRKLPKGMTIEMVNSLVGYGCFDLTPFAISTNSEPVPVADAIATAVDSNNIDKMFTATGELKLTVNTPAEAKEYEANGKRCIDCLNCGKQMSYTRLSMNNTKKCPFCGHANLVMRI